MKLINAFSTPIALLRCPQASSINNKLHDIIKAMSQDQPSDDQGRAHVGGWYSRGGFLSRDEPEVGTLAAFFQRSVEGYLAEAVSEEFAQIRKLNFHTWAALTQPKEYQPPHVHAKSHLSGVYYVNVPQVAKPQGTLELMTPVGEQELAFFAQVSPTKINVQPSAGDLVIFPSYLRHYTHPFFEGADRSLVVFTVNCF
ncbi:MAG: putative 2OG-Fe(II) oxygenase [Halioglobus sp.]